MKRAPALIFPPSVLGTSGQNECLEAAPLTQDQSADESLCVPVYSSQTPFPGLRVHVNMLKPNGVVVLPSLMWRVNSVGHSKKHSHVTSGEDLL